MIRSAAGICTQNSVGGRLDAPQLALRRLPPGRHPLAICDRNCVVAAANLMSVSIRCGSDGCSGKWCASRKQVHGAMRPSRLYAA